MSKERGIMCFDEFWRKFPRKVGKLAARKAFDRSLKHASVDEIMAGLQRFLEAKPWRNDLQFCPHPTTWLNQGRWDDEHPDPDPEDPAPRDWWERAASTERIRAEVAKLRGRNIH